MGAASSMCLACLNSYGQTLFRFTVCCAVSAPGDSGHIFSFPMMVVHAERARQDSPAFEVAMSFSLRWQCTP